MGGIGSGRRNQDGRLTTCESRPLDIRQLHRNGLLMPGKSFGWSWTCNGEKMASIHIRVEPGYVVLRYRIQGRDSEWQQKEYPVYLEWTDCNLGGQRPWFHCPTLGCGKRVAILYAGSVFTCRHCKQLAYACQRETRDDRAARRAETIRGRLGWEPGILNGEGIKPKGMHWRRYERLRSEHNAYAIASIAQMRLRYRLISHELDGLGIDLEGLYGVD